MATRTKPSGADSFSEFGKYFRNYMSVAATVTAAMPLVAAGAKVIPVYESLERALSACASLFCFLMFAYVFYIRQSLAQAMFASGDLSRRWRVIPLVLIVLSVASGLGYLAVLRQSVESAHEALNKQGVEITDSADVMRLTDYTDTPNVFALILLYLGFFVSAEAAFVLMAAREYLLERTKVKTKAKSTAASPGPPE